MKCIKCKKEIDTGKKYCKYCGTPVAKSIEENNKIIEEERNNAEKAQEFVKCQRCGKKTYADRNFCVHCGAPIMGGNDSQNNKTKRSHKWLKKVGIAFVCVITLAIVIVIGFLFLKNKIDMNRLNSIFGKKESSVVETSDDVVPERSVPDEDEKSSVIEKPEESNRESSIIEPEGLVSSNDGQDAEISAVESEIISDPPELVNLMDNISAVPYSWNPNAGESFHKSTGKNRLRSWNNEKYGGLIQLYPNEIYKLSIKSSEEMDFNIGYILFSTEDGTDDVPDGLPFSSGWIYIDNNKDMYEFTINTSERNYYLGINLANKDRSELTESEIACLKEVLKNIYLEKEE